MVAVNTTTGCSGLAGPPPPWVRRGTALAPICHGKRAAGGTVGRARRRAAGKIDVVEVPVGHAVEVDAAGSTLE